VAEFEKVTKKKSDARPEMLKIEEDMLNKQADKLLEFKKEIAAKEEKVRKMEIGEKRSNEKVGQMEDRQKKLNATVAEKETELGNAKQQEVAVQALKEQASQSLEAAKAAVDAAYERQEAANKRFEGAKTTKNIMASDLPNVKDERDRRYKELDEAKKAEKEEEAALKTVGDDVASTNATTNDLAARVAALRAEINDRSSSLAGNQTAVKEKLRDLEESKPFIVKEHTLVPNLEKEMARRRISQYKLE